MLKQYGLKTDLGMGNTVRNLDPGVGSMVYNLIDLGMGNIVYNLTNLGMGNTVYNLTDLSVGNIVQYKTTHSNKTLKHARNISGLSVKSRRV